MLETSLRILFYLKKPKGYQKGNMPVYMRITVNGLPAEMTTKHECDPERWNSDAERVRGTNGASKTLNALLDILERKVHDARIALLETRKEITAIAIKDVLQGREKKPRMLLEIFEQHNTQIAELVNKDFAPGTIARYNTTLSHARDFIKWKYSPTDFELRNLSFEFISGFDFI